VRRGHSVMIALKLAASELDLMIANVDRIFAKFGVMSSANFGVGTLYKAVQRRLEKVSPAASAATQEGTLYSIS
jgi:hypothetical protein